MKNDKINTEVELKVLETMLENDGLVIKKEIKEIEKMAGNKTFEINDNKNKSLNYEYLVPKEKEIVDGIVQSLSKLDTNSIINYGSNVQGKMSEFSSTVLENIRTKKINEVGDVLASLVANINDFDIEATTKKRGIFKIFQSAKNTAERLLAKYSKVETNIDKIINTLENNKIQLLKDVTTFEVMYEENMEFFKQISLYIIAGEKKVKELREVDLVKLQAQAKNDGEEMDFQTIEDMTNKINSFEKKIYDLKLTRMLSIQMAPQIRMLQANDSELVEKIQSSIINTIPLWKTQLVLALGITNSKMAYQAQKSVTDTTNKLLRKNSELLKQGSIDIAKESDRAIVDLETVKHVNNNIIATVEEVLKINEASKQKRVLATKELEDAQIDLKTGLFELQTHRNEE